MPTIDEAAVNLDAKPEIPEATDADPGVQQSETSGFQLNFDWLMKPTGEGSIDDYIDHPLNFKQSRGLAQMIRGLHGLFGEIINVWITDVVFGFMKFKQESGGKQMDNKFSRDWCLNMLVDNNGNIEDLTELNGNFIYALNQILEDSDNSTDTLSSRVRLLMEVYQNVLRNMEGDAE